MILMAIDTSPVSVALAVALHGVAWGARGPLMMAIRADYFGRQNLGVIAGWSSVITMTGSVGGPVYAGLMHDAFGSYTTAFWTLGATTVASTFFFLAARKPLPPGPPTAGAVASAVE